MLSLLTLCFSAETSLLLEGDLPSEGLDHVFIPFEVPEGTVEIEIRHGDTSEANILDWGLDDPQGFRGWGGGNSEAAIVGVQAASRSYLPGPFPAGTWQVVIGKAQIIESPAHYTIEIIFRDTATLAAQTMRQPYIAAPALQNNARWYAGDLHVHSRESGDARPDLDSIAAFARQRGLDFVEISDHNTTSQLDYFADVQSRWPDLLFVPGVEFTTYDGHANGIGATQWVDHRLGQPGVDIEGAAAAFADQGAFFSINHPSLDLGDVCIGCAWQQPLAPSAIQGIELITGGLDPVGGLFLEETLALWESLVAQGFWVVPVGGSDDHRGGSDEGVTDSPIGSPTTMIYAENLSVEALLAGLRAGHTVVKLQGPEDPMLELWPTPTDFEATVSGGAGAQLQWVVDGVVLREVDVTDAVFVDHFMPAANAHAVRTQLQIENRLRVITAYQLFTSASDPKGCGCAAVPGPLSWILAVPLVLILGRRRQQH